MSVSVAVRRQLAAQPVTVRSGTSKDTQLVGQQGEEEAQLCQPVCRLSPCSTSSTAWERPRSLLHCAAAAAAGSQSSRGRERNRKRESKRSVEAGVLCTTLSCSVFQVSPAHACQHCCTSEMKPMNMTGSKRNVVERKTKAVSLTVSFSEALLLSDVEDQLCFCFFKMILQCQH